MDNRYVNWEQVLQQFGEWFAQQNTPDWESQFDKLVELVDAQLYEMPEEYSPAKHAQGLRQLGHRFGNTELLDMAREVEKSIN